jgi:A/G-specific adenine glycosylase
MPQTTQSALHEPLLEWFDTHARDLPWRGAGARGWPVLVSEVMLQQTPVARVLPVFAAWLARWPAPADLAVEPPGEAVLMWGRLGYPRRALRLHGAARAIVERHGGLVPASYDDLRALAGVGDYTAAAVASFAYRQRHVVLDTNIRRVLARLIEGREHEPAGAPSRAERDRAEGVLPDAAGEAATWSAALMELGALVCSARAPRCADCPLAASCRWRLAGQPPWDGPPRRGQSNAGTDRAVRGRLLAAVRDEGGPVTRAALEAVWTDDVQRERSLDGLVADGLVEPLDDGTYRLPR